jgi:hypothetical protein
MGATVYFLVRLKLRKIDSSKSLFVNRTAQEGLSETENGYKAADCPVMENEHTKETEDTIEVNHTTNINEE